MKVKFYFNIWPRLIILLYQNTILRYNNPALYVRVNNLWVLFLTSEIREMKSGYRVSDNKQILTVKRK